MSLDQTGGLEGRVRFPRVSGDEPDATVRKWTQRWFSPRERG